VQTDPDTGGLLNRGINEYIGYNITAVLEFCEGNPDERSQFASNWCGSCWNGDLQEVDDLILLEDIYPAVVSAMGAFDWTCLLLASGVVALAVVSELRDVTLCELQKLHASKDPGCGWRTALDLLTGIRRSLFLPGLVITVPYLVVLKGGDALNVCFNTLAVLFLCEVDNAAYAYGIGEKVKGRVERIGHIHLTAAEEAGLTVNKTAHIVIVVVIVVGSVASIGGLGGSRSAFDVLLTYPFVAFWLGGLVASYQPGKTFGEVAKTMSWHTLSSILGWVAYIAMFLIAWRV
jgi:hypothetical protein